MLIRGTAAGLLCLVGWGGAAGCQSDTATLADWMTGSFTSRSQHLRDPENYFDISLKMVPIWPEREDGPWLYVEQAASARLDKPYRQRVYHLVYRPDGTIHSVIYKLPEDPLQFAGAWRERQPLAGLTPDDLTLLPGCHMVMRRVDRKTFAGGTVEDHCTNRFRGAAYATSEATVHPDCLISWDRGYDAAGNHVWGATEGGYVFEKTGDASSAAK
jgi:CpeT protein